MVKLMSMGGYVVCERAESQGRRGRWPTLLLTAHHGVLVLQPQQLALAWDFLSKKIGARTINALDLSPLLGTTILIFWIYFII